MIIEGLVTTLDEDRSPRISPMGLQVDAEIQRVVLRPYRSSQTYRNLKQRGQGVFHVTDDVELLAHAAVHQLETLPPLLPAEAVEGVILADACRWYAFRVQRLDDANERTCIECDVVERGRRRDFLGFNRAKHAVLEAAILSTRLEFLPESQVLDEFNRLGVIVEKTAGDQERRAFEFLHRYVQRRFADDETRA